MSVNLSSQSHPNSPILAPVGDVRSPIEQKVAQLSKQLASIKLTNANKEAEVGNVAAELDKIKKIFKGLSNNEVAGLNQMIQGFHILLEGLSAQVLEIARLGSGVQHDVPEMSILFSGNPRETRQFVFQARTVLHEKSDCFRSEKSKINWIVRHFCNPGSNSGEPCPLYNWWMSLLFENARIQDLPTDSVSVEDPYVLDSLSTSKEFLSQLELTFEDKHEIQTAKQRLFSFRQGNKSIEEFNALFNSLCYSVNLTEESRCDCYERALNPKILKIAVLRGDWKITTTLRGKQALAALAAEAQDKISSIDSGSLPVFQQKQQPYHHRPNPPPPPPPARASDVPAPMDLDVLSAESSFTFTRFRALCYKKRVCQRCGGSFNDEHKANKGCPLPSEKHIDVQRKVELFRNWLAQGGQDVVDALARAAEDKRVAKTSRGSNPSGGTAEVPLDAIPPLSLGELCWQQAASKIFADNMEVDRDLCKSNESIFLPFSSPRPIVPIHLLPPNLPSISALSLFDSGASASFIDERFVSRNHLVLHRLAQPLLCRGFDGSLNRSGQITHCWQGQIIIPLPHSKTFRSSVVLYVTRLASASVILGFPWFSSNKISLSGCPSGISFPFSNQSLSVNAAEILPNFLQEFKNVFVTQSLSSLPPHRGEFDCSINLKPNSNPPFVGMYNLSASETEQLREYVDENLRKGFIRESSSPAGAPIFFVKTQNKADRPCVDYRCKFLSKVDLKAAFNLLRIAPGHEWKTAFRTPWGLYEYCVMPFGLANAPAIFQRFIQHVLREYSRSSLNKCQFFQSEVKFLGFVITRDGIRMDPSKLSTILDWPYPNSLQQLRRFLGFSNFYRRFIPKFSDLARPSNKFNQRRTLHSGESHLPRVLHVDSSGYAIAAVLSQPDSNGALHPVSYFSRKLSDRERSWPIFDLEMLAIVSAFEEWRAWLMGTEEPVKVYSDHANLRYFRSAKYSLPNRHGGLHRPEIKQSGILTKHLHGETVDDIELPAEIAESASHDLFFQRPADDLLELIRNQYSTLEDDEKEALTFRENLFWHQDRVFVPVSHRERIIQFHHDAPTTGHPGIARTLSLLTRSFSWPGIRKDVIQFVKSCDSCQRVKARRQLQEGQLNSLDIPQRPWSVIGMDFITKLPKSGGFDSIMVVMDLLSKATHFIPCKETYLAPQVAQLFRTNVFRLHGIPEKIISDRGLVFVSEFWKSFMFLLGIKKGFSTAYHPPTDGQTERMNQVLEDYLRHFCSYYQDNWDKLLDLAEFSINNLDSSSLGVSPFFFSYGFHPKFSVLNRSSSKKSLDGFIQDMQEVQERAVECLTQAQQQQARYYNAHKRPATQYNPGDLVLLLRKFIESR
ncbi:hypothetical protein PSTT_10875 [Puccinia striiformis]|uniref:Integrase catalytic domain-containing protein n=2 Tax=Puccinia striiformis TaxID=27350 RepID=A0A2S4V2H0_9BASI|nr:hypothetical protein PSTT_10875 [Puccinia striiformis]